MPIKNFQDFLNEWEMTSHWIERSSLSHKISRVVPLSNNKEDGWTCDELIVLDSDGIETRQRVSLVDFLEESGMKESEFKDKVTKSLHFLANSQRAEVRNYRDLLHRAVYMGKLGFPLRRRGPEGRVAETVVFSPVLRTKEGSGNQMWGVVIEQDSKPDKGVTILYFTRPTEEQLLGRAHRNYQEKTKSPINLQTYKTNKWGGVDSIFSENFVLIVPPIPKWEAMVKREADFGSTWTFPTEVVYQRDEKLEKWKSFLLKEATTIFDVGTELWVKGYDTAAIKAAKEKGIELEEKPVIEEVKTIVELDKASEVMLLTNENGINSRKSMPKVGETVHIVSREVPELREIGGLPEGGILIKSVKVESYRAVKNEKGVTRNGVFGPILDYYVILNGRKVFSALK
jgi:hypothetical protein